MKRIFIMFGLLLSCSQLSAGEFEQKAVGTCQIPNCLECYPQQVLLAQPIPCDNHDCPNLICQDYHRQNQPPVITQVEEAQGPEVPNENVMRRDAPLDSENSAGCCECCCASLECVGGILRRILLDNFLCHNSSHDQDHLCAGAK